MCCFSGLFLTLRKTRLGWWGRARVGGQDADSVLGGHLLAGLSRQWIPAEWRCKSDVWCKRAPVYTCILIGTCVWFQLEFHLKGEMLHLQNLLASLPSSLYSLRLNTAPQCHAKNLPIMSWSGYTNSYQSMTAFMNPKQHIDHTLDLHKHLFQCQ